MASWSSGRKGNPRSTDPPCNGILAGAYRAGALLAGLVYPATSCVKTSKVETEMLEADPAHRQAYSLESSYGSAAIEN